MALLENRSIVPVPDPTLLTTQQLLRENVWLREVIEARINGMDKTIAQRQAALDLIPAAVDDKVKNLKELHSEKFGSIATQLEERDTAVTAAFQAAKDAVGQQTMASDRAIAKSEAAITKQIDQLGVLIATTTAGLDGKISDLKERLTLIEGKGTGVATMWAAVAAAIGILIAIASLVIASMAK